jgi:hypothetical protein
MSIMDNNFEDWCKAGYKRGYEEGEKKGVSG